MNKIRIVNKKRFALFVFCVVAIIGGTFWGVKKYRETHPKSTYDMTMAEASKKGEKKVYQLLIKINKPSQNAAPGGYERGDIVLTAPEDKQFSVAEQEGFLIIKMGLTQQQADLLTMSKEPEKIPEKEDKKAEVSPQNQLRRFSVDFSKIGISSDEEKGRVIDDKVFNWQDVVKEKNNS